MAATASPTVSGGLSRSRIRATSTPARWPQAHQTHRIWLGMVERRVPPRLSILIRKRLYATFPSAVCFIERTAELLRQHRAQQLLHVGDSIVGNLIVGRISLVCLFQRIIVRFPVRNDLLWNRF